MFPNVSGSISAMDDNLVRLGELVQARRIALGWSKREQFAQQVSFSYRVLTDLENGNRRLGKASYREIETVLGWAVGSVDNVLDGGEPFEREALQRVVEEIAQRPEKGGPAAISNIRMARVLQMVTSGQLDERAMDEATEALDDLLIAIAPELFDALPRPSKLEVARLAQQLFTEAQAQEEVDDVEAASTEGTPSAKHNEKIHAADGRNNDGTLIEEGQGNRGDENQSDYDLALRTGDGPSRGRRIRDQHDRDTEAPDAPGPEDGA